MTDPTVEAVALAIGHSMASFASGNNMPDMSGDPRNRIPKALRHSFDRAVGYAAQAAIAAHDSALKAEVARLRELLRIFTGCAYPVADEINPRGYNWSEAYLDQALAAYRKEYPDDRR